jgi:hypothetical protein
MTDFEKSNEEIEIVVSDLAQLVKRLVYALRHGCKNDELSEKAMDYLNRKGLMDDNFKRG